MIFCSVSLLFFGKKWGTATTAQLRLRASSFLCLASSTSKSPTLIPLEHVFWFVPPYEFHTHGRVQSLIKTEDRPCEVMGMSSHHVWLQNPEMVCHFGSFPMQKPYGLPEIHRWLLSPTCNNQLQFNTLEDVCFGLPSKMAEGSFMWYPLLSISIHNVCPCENSDFCHML